MLQIQQERERRSRHLGRSSVSSVPGGELELTVDLKRHLMFPSEVTTTSFWPDFILFSASSRMVIMAELCRAGRAALWEEGMEATREKGEICRSGCCMFLNWVESCRLSSCQVQWLHWNIRSLFPDISLTRRFQRGGML